MKIIPVNRENAEMFAGFLPRNEEGVVDSDVLDSLTLGCVDESEEGNIAVGAMFAWYTPFSSVIEWLAVSEPFRRKGVGSLLIKTLKQVLAPADIGEIHVVSCSDEGELEVLDSFFGSNGFVTNEKNSSYSVKVSDLKNNEFFTRQKLPKLPMEGIVSLGEVPEILTKKFNAYLSRPHDFIHSKIDFSEFCPRCSTLKLKDGEISGCVLIKPLESDSVSLSWLYTSTPGDVMPMLNRSFNAVSAEYSDESRVHIAAVNSASLKLLKKIIGDSAVAGANSRVYSCVLGVL
ncbi:MAG: GNAT family N-acetyltransferase [Oscillospiraceae bacterium]|nr:GNAT family N-acetyltransferase [Oscillospiraceae bacterium]